MLFLIEKRLLIMKGVLMYLVSLYFDEKTNGIIRNHMKQVAKKTGNDNMIINNVPPHITVAAFGGENAENVIERLALKLREINKGEITWTGIGVFLPNVIYITPVLNEYLDTVSRFVYNYLQDLKKTDSSFSEYGFEINSKYIPFNWIPHTTIGKQLSSDEMQKAFLTLKDRFGMFSGCVTKIGIAKTNPYTDISKIDLKG